MLKKNRAKVMQSVLDKLQYELNHTTLNDGSFTAPTNGQSYTMHGYGGEIAAPYQAQGWPPEVQEYIKRVALATAMAVIDNIYTEEELNERVDGILLTDEDRHTKS